MTVTTIKVSAELRDRLKSAAVVQHRTLAEHIEALLDREERDARFARLREQMALNPPDDAYLRDADEWQSERW